MFLATSLSSWFAPAESNILQSNLKRNYTLQQISTKLCARQLPPASFLLSFKKGILLNYNYSLLSLSLYCSDYIMANGTGVLCSYACKYFRCCYLHICNNCQLPHPEIVCRNPAPLADCPCQSKFHCS